MPLDPVQLSADLIKLPSVTPDAQNTMDFLEETLKSMGFTVMQHVFHEDGTDPVPNLYARLGDKAPNLCFAGHTDVVPVGNIDGWTVPPFAADIIDGQLYGRGAADMKSAIAAFICAVQSFLETDSGLDANLDAITKHGSISFLITGDEEGPAINGTKKMLDYITDQGEKLDYCIVGEPTNPREMGQMIKVGRRGSLHGHVTVNGTQGHVAYPHLAHNPIPDLVAILAELNDSLDDGNDHFQPSNLEIVDVHVGNQTHNVIPAKAEAFFNIRFNNIWTPESLRDEVTKRLNRAGKDYNITWHLSGDSFLSEHGLLTDALVKAVEQITGRTPELSTSGGTSDARFIKNFCPVAEFGLVGQTMHKVDEHVATSDISMLTDIYKIAIKEILHL